MRIITINYKSMLHIFNNKIHIVFQIIPYFIYNKRKVNAKHLLIKTKYFKNK